MNTIQRILPLALLTLVGVGVVSCDDPMAERERFIQQTAAQRNNGGVHTTSQRFTFTKWIEKSKDSFLLPSINDEETGENTFWASASNDGYSLLAQGVDSYPVIPLKEGGENVGALIRSIKGFYFFGMGTNVIAGALYSGRVNRGSLVSKPLESTEFGQPYTAGVPDEMEFIYQYKAGEKVIHGQGKRNIPLPATDKGTAAAIFYDVTEDEHYLNGTNLHTNGRILARGYVELEPTEEGKWTTYKLKLQPTDQTRYDAIDLKTRKYRLALVFSSSFRGAEYIGAVGSELRLKEVVIKDRPKKNN